MGLLLTKCLPKAKIVYDIRGAGENIIENINFKDKMNIERDEFRKKITIFSSDRILCVSNKLKEYVQQKYGFARNKNIDVIHNVGENKTFFFDNQIRENIRRQLNLGDNIVLLYSGHLDKPWQIPEKIFQLFIHLMGSIQNIKLLILTPDKRIASDYLEKYKINQNKIIIRTVSYHELNKYYNSADFSLLLREDKLVNNVASPTKFSEYILCGLPTIITESLGDYSNIVEKNNLGVIISDINDVQKNINKIVSYIQGIVNDNNDYKKKRIMISSWGSMNLSKEKLLSKYIIIYKDIVNNAKQ